MNCFEWQNRSSDYLDGNLIGSMKRSADDHLEGCGDCRVRLQRYRQILQSLSSQPRVPLPIPIRKAPLARTIGRLDLASLTRGNLLDKSPWFVRTSVEGLGVAFLLLFVIAVVPRIRTIYESGIERRLDAFSLGSPSGPDSGDSPAPLRGRLGPEGTGAVAGEEFSGEYGEDDGSEEAAVESDDVQVGSSEIWRFSLKTDSPHEVQPKIVLLLKSLGVAAETPGLGGTEAPGGIQFDVLLPTQIVANLKAGLKKLAAPTVTNVVDAPENQGPTATFTWYRNKSKRKIPAGKARVVIWLSQV